MAEPAFPAYCLKCERPNNCLCGTKDYQFIHSRKLRVPTDTRKKVKFRAFLDACPMFANCVPDELKDQFRALLRKVKYFDKAMNGHEWTRVTK